MTVIVLSSVFLKYLGVYKETWSKFIQKSLFYISHYKNARDNISKHKPGYAV